MSESILIRNLQAIMTGLPGAASRHAGPDIRIDGGTVAAIGKLAPQPGERIIDATDCVAYPAWVNTHHHLFQSLLKGDPMGINASLTPWLAATPYRYRAKFDAELFRLAARIGMVELMRSGCGTIADHNYLYYPGMPFDTSEILFDEAEKLGLRFVLCRGTATRTRQLEAELPSALRPETLDGFLQDMARLAKRFHDPSPAALRRVVMAPTTPLYSASPEELREMAQAGRALGLRLHSHLSETVGYQDSAYSMHGCSPVAFCERIGWLGQDVWFAHLVQLDEEEIRLLGVTGTGIAHCPQSNGRLGSGIAPIRALEAAGVPVSIGVDGAASNEAADMISETHAAWLMQRARRGQQAIPAFRGGAYEGGADEATVEDVVRWGSSGGARVLGLGALDGLRIGQQADIALYRLDDPRYFGLHDPAIGPVVAGGRPGLKSLLVAGREVVRDDAIPGVELAALGRQARDAVRKLLGSC
ncbi:MULTISPECIES: amidohydrolase family protein [unclassified Herbaspirillum]|uniref:amidohydrolase family protein n=1 Tax=unclassified Herbaspirillum TaxID=2624150 RepID=UPI0011521CB8|nr:MULTISPECIES: amidohydrolase family protein [unclassified Herbaspirillum]MBB5392562.1 cytosine/adenosine deaminase-related metal-dependent hydrolase [Herbaspirillum sp. SJZ102]TQK06199.1 cytosine/adenosine deaminase-related metal-dependent hydrolase [Herbaspirillum sp. SJZ130]TQK12323.1 cytosine/adenosine deaminase-related metal-dependent hydrolase [Herbaspirillum sp. SJZ106]